MGRLLLNVGVTLALVGIGGPVLGILIFANSVGWTNEDWPFPLFIDLIVLAVGLIVVGRLTS